MCLTAFVQELVSANMGKYYTGKLCNDIIKLVEPLVQKKMQDNAPRAVAVRSTNQDIVDEKVPPGFLSKLKTVTEDAVVPVLAEAAKILTATALTQVATRCSLM